MRTPLRRTATITQPQIREHLLKALDGIEILDSVEINETLGEYVDDIITVSVKGRRQTKQVNKS